MKIVGLLLAAGNSRRYGSNKLTRKLPCGTPMVARTAQNILSANIPVTAIVRANDHETQAILSERGVSVITPRTIDAGLGDNIATLVAAQADADAWIIMLGDMPFVKSSVITQLTKLLIDGAEIVAPFYQDRRGHPVGFNHKWRPALLGLNGDRGAASIISESKGIARVETFDQSVITDIDTVDNWDAALSNFR